MTIGEKTKGKKTQCDFSRDTTEITTISFGKIYKYEH